MNLPLLPPANSRAGWRRTQAGVGLIEVLVALLVLSLGVLGIAALQVRALANGGSSMSMTMATVASYSILEAMRADRTNAVAGSYNGSITGDACPASGTSLSAWNLNQWCTNQLIKYLPAASTTRANITCTSTNSSCTVTIQYDDSRAGGSSAQQVKIAAGL